MNRLESGMLQARPDWCEVSEVVYAAVGQLTDEQVKNVKVMLSEDLPLIKIDIGFTSQSSVQPVAKCAYLWWGGEIEVGADLYEGYVDLFVKDQGPGLDEEDTLRVLRNFIAPPAAKLVALGWAWP